MKRPLTIFLSVLILAAIVCNDAWSRGGRGGGRGGGGGFRGGGGGRSMSAGGMSRGGGARTPSMSRPSVSRPAPSRPSVSRPTTRPSVSRPSAGNAARPNINRPSTGGNRPNINRPGAGANRPQMNRPGSGTGRPNLNRPNLGSGNQSGFFNRPSAGDLGDFLDLPGGNRPTTLPGQVDRPNLGNRPGDGNRPGPGNRPGTGDRPNLGNRPNNGNRPNISNRPNINVGNQVNINRQNNINSIRNHWSNVNRRPLGRDWWSRHPSTLPGWRWHGGWGRYPAHWCWRPATWAAFGTWFAWNWAQPVVYDYGSSVVYRDNYVYVDDQQYATADAYYQQADTIAESVPQDVDPEQVEWMPLGVFAIAEEGGTDTGMLVQLAVSEEGIIAGTFYNDITDEGRPLEGTVDRENQRAAWKFADGKNPEIVMETAIYNLTQDESTALVHFGPDKTQTWLMVRLPEPEEKK